MNPDPASPDPSAPSYGTPPSAEEEPASEPILKIASLDPEEWLGIKAGRFTDVNGKLSFVLGILLALGVVGIVDQLDRLESVAPFTSLLLDRGLIPYAIVALCCWALAILILKSVKLRGQRRALAHTFVPAAQDFVLAPGTADAVLRRMRSLVDDPKRFALLNRIELALSNLSNIGRVSDVSEMLTTQADNDESQMQSSFSLIRGFVWAIPVLGFIGTVLGLSAAIGGFGGVLSQSSEIAQLTEALKDVTAGLSVAFDTTLLGLVVALFLQLLVTWQMKREEDFLHACKEYCHLHVIGKLRLLDVGSYEPAPQGMSEEDV